MTINDANSVLIMQGNAMIEEVIKGYYYRVVPRTSDTCNVTGRKFKTVKEAYDYAINLPSDWMISKQ